MPSSSSEQPTIEARFFRAAQRGKKQYSDASLEQFELENRRAKKRLRTDATAHQVAVPVIAPLPVNDDSDDEPDALDLLDSDKFFRTARTPGSRVDVVVVSSDGEEDVEEEEEKEEKEKDNEEKMDVDEVVDDAALVVDEVMSRDGEDGAVHVGEEVVEEGEDEVEAEVEEGEEDEEDEEVPAKKTKTIKNIPKNKKTNVKVTAGGTGKKRLEGKGKTEDTVQYEELPDTNDKSEFGMQRSAWMSKKVSPPKSKTRCRISIANLHIRSSAISSDNS